ncbi:DUF481 domain-containing protein [Bythopirellula goksoeyrii]|uniref:DUF481 domain-containing protein n=1 Tax=Bythopirellula goksoeyrii TaxID=1400387 RepID=A0A5B9Q9C4_9BACT|nr:DUF481 domain-containing protein [Bythopirellula goksoeyrii]QEG33546.1 hypothetical protein Pr1d_08100 [Bythopirellula goksoeyrii]
MLPQAPDSFCAKSLLTPWLAAMSYLRITGIPILFGMIFASMAFCCASKISAAGDTNGPGVLPPPSTNLKFPNPTEFPETLLPPPTTTATEEFAGEEIEGITPSEDLLAPIPIYHWYEAGYWFGPTPWDIGMEFGLNGSEGANQTQSVTVGGHWKRKTKTWKSNTKIAYNRNSANRIETQNNALLDTRIDRQFEETPWSMFALNQLLYDEFQAYDLRVSLNSGVGYQWFDTEIFDLETRFGAGTSREFGGPDNRWTREALFGMETEYSISATQRLTAKADYFPEFEHFGQYRVVTDAGWEIDLDRPANVSLKFSVNDRYDSTPNGVDPNLLNYSALLIWGL